MSRFDAVIFDLDGTLIDSAPDIHAAANAAITGQGFDPITPERARGYVGRGVPVFVERFRKDFDIGPEFQAPIVEAFLARYETAVEMTTLYPGVQSCLEGLVAQGMATGLCTNKPIKPTRFVLSHFGWNAFDVVLGGDSLSVKKPDPRPLQHCIAELGAKTPLYVGDSEVDAETAQRADVPFALFTEGYRKAPVADLPHDFAFDHFDALMTWIGKS